MVDPREDEPKQDHDGLTHPKFTGLRMADPSGPMPSCQQFLQQYLDDDSVYGGYTRLQCSDEEKSRCKDLKAAVARVQGPKDAITMLRFLRARQGDVNLAAQMYQASMKWRNKEQLHSGFYLGTIDDTLHRRFDGSWKVLGLLGRDRDGDPIIWERLGRAVMGTCAITPTKFLVEHEVYTMVRTQQAMDELCRAEGKPYMYYTVIEDLDGLGLQHCSWTALQKYKECVRIGQDHYPEMVKRIVIVRAPWIFAKVWSIVQTFFDEGTRQKIQIVSAKDTKKVLDRFIDNKWLPVSLGGQLQIESNADCEPLVVIPKEVPPSVTADIRAAYKDD